MFWGHELRNFWMHKFLWIPLLRGRQQFCENNSQKNFSVKRPALYTFLKGKKINFTILVFWLIIRDFTRIYSVLKIGHLSVKEVKYFNDNIRKSEYVELFLSVLMKVSCYLLVIG